MLGVARKAYAISKAQGYNEEFARHMFLLGWMHDVGYEFAESKEQHSHISAQMYLLLTKNEPDIAYRAIKERGRLPELPTEEWKILTMADMLTDSNGNEVSAEARLSGIRQRYGMQSEEYKTSCEVCKQIGLVDKNYGQE